MSCLMDSTRVKRAGAFLDDLQAKVVLSGFCDQSHIQALKRVLGVAGATCMNQINKTVTHIIVGQRGERVVLIKLEQYMYFFLK